LIDGAMSFFSIEKFIGNYPEDALQDIWEKSLPSLDKRRIEWGYIKNPAGPAVLYMLWHKKEKKFFGCCAVLPGEYKYGEEVISVGIPADFAILPEYRSLGPAIALQKEIIKDGEFEAYVAFPNRISAKIQKYVGYKRIGFYKELRIFRNIAILMYFVGRSIIKELSKRSGKKSNFRRSFVERFLEKDTSCNASSGSTENLWCIRSLSYVKWKYFKNPFIQNEVHGERIGNKFLVYSGKEKFSAIIWDMFDESMKPVFDLKYIHRLLNVTNKKVAYFSIAGFRPIHNGLLKLTLLDLRQGREVLFFSRRNLHGHLVKPILTGGDVDFF
jgi:hypothetical protein